ncbi:protein phosphatase 1 regulatory subunit 3G [Oryzias latipes]|uniref:Protein phosphatase 1 regulatory subunit 3G n=1 Tax=Oryzias latipes TaxID=8090 RepID=A0A3B3IH24_ORYLA|nr:protein phosphatase 1 regulatory subunit 3G [Oryzias latipes]
MSSPLHPHAGAGAPWAELRSENGLDNDEDNDDEDLEDAVDAQRLQSFMRCRRRARSLPACTGALLDSECGRKRVTFADSMGLTLARVKHFSAHEDPQIPSKVLSRHKSFPLQQQDLHALSQSLLDPDRLVPCFPELRDAERRVRTLRVCLEKVAVTQLDVRAQIRVLTPGTVSEVGLRYTFNDWQSHVDAQALPACAEDPDLLGQRFCVTVYTPPFLESGAAVHFAVYLRGEDGEFWDNNDGSNYTLRYRSACGDAPFTSAAFEAT